MSAFDEWVVNDYNSRSHLSPTKDSDQKVINQVAIGGQRWCWPAVVRF